MNLVANAMQGINDDVIKSARGLLEHLFPGLQGVYGNTHYGAEWEKSWAQAKRVCAHTYASRYFSYAIPENDVSDQELNDFVMQTKTLGEDQVSERFARLANGRNADVLISKLRLSVETLSPEACVTLSKVLVTSASLFPNSPAIFFGLNTFSKAALLVSALVAKIANEDDRVELAKKLVILASTLLFGATCLRWFLRNTNEKPETSWLQRTRISGHW
jgi:hypothetical protein